MSKTRWRGKEGTGHRLLAPVCAYRSMCTQGSVHMRMHTHRGWGETCLSSWQSLGPDSLFFSLSLPPTPLQTLFLSHGARWLAVQFSIRVYIYSSSIKFMGFWQSLNKRLYYIPYLFSKVTIAPISSLLLRNNEHGLECFRPSGPGVFYAHWLFCPALLIWCFTH